MNDVDDLGSLHWTALRKMVEDAGGRYEGKPQAIEFLTTGKPAEVSSDVAVQVVAHSSSGITLDRSRPFGHVSGDIEEAPNARYFQGGHYFNTQGEKVG